MQSSAALDDSQVESHFYSAILPTGWTMYSGYLKQDLRTSPAYDSNGYAQYNIFRDSADDAFQQITWAKSGVGVAQQIPGMVVWGGPRSDVIRGNPNADNIIHGAQGNDKIYADGYINTVYGDAGVDTVVFRGSRSRYTITRVTQDASEVVVRRKGPAGATHISTLYNVERLAFRNGVYERGPHGRFRLLQGKLAHSC